MVVNYEHVNIERSEGYNENALILCGCSSIWHNKDNKAYASYFDQHAQIIVPSSGCLSFADYNCVQRLLRLSRKVISVTFHVGFDVDKIPPNLEEIASFASLVCKRNRLMNFTLVGRCALICWKSFTNEEITIENIARKTKNALQSRVIYNTIQEIMMYPAFY